MYSILIQLIQILLCLLVWRPALSPPACPPPLSLPHHHHPSLVPVTRGRDHDID